MHVRIIPDVSRFNSKQQIMEHGVAKHFLTPLLKPRSIAITGASNREGSAGHGMVAGLLNAGFSGGIYPVNPRYDSVQGLPCFRSLRDLPEPVDLAVLGVNSIYLEDMIDDAIACKIGSAVIFDTCYLDGESDRGLLNRLKQKAHKAGLPVCGGNGMGFINVEDRVPITLYDASYQLEQPGNITFITHSGTVFSEVGLNDFRYGCNIIISSGQEINGTVADYMDYALTLSSTRVIALFIEEARDPAAFVAALNKARQNDIPVVAMKVGRSRLSGDFARVHSDADTGDDRAYQAVFDRYDVLRAGSIEEMANLLTLLSHPRQIVQGGIGLVLDSGGEREMVTDMAEDLCIPFAEISPETSQRIRPHLHHALEPVNPLDAWGTAANYEDDFVAYFSALDQDDDVALVMFCGDFQWNPTVERGYALALVTALPDNTKPLMTLLNTPMSGLMTAGRQLSERGVIVLFGTREGLHAIRHALTWRDRLPVVTDAVSVNKASQDDTLGEPTDRTNPDDNLNTLCALSGICIHSDPPGKNGLIFESVHDRQFGQFVGIRKTLYGEAEPDSGVLFMPGLDRERCARNISRIMNTAACDADDLNVWSEVLHKILTWTSSSDGTTCFTIGPVHVLNGAACIAIDES